MMKATKMIAMLLAMGMFLGLGASARAAIVTQPAGLSPGDQYRLVFVTSTETYSGGSNHGSNPPWFTTAADYNAFGTTAATAVTELNDLGTTWTAIVSTRDELPGNPTVDARDNTGTNPVWTGVPVYNLGGLIVANNNADLWDGSIANPINVTELGTGPTTQRGGLFRVWTGTTASGTNAGGQRLIWQDGGWIRECQ